MIDKIYFYINEILNSYLNEGIKAEHLLNYLNGDKKNYEYIYNRIYRKLTLENIQFESNDLEECLKDSIRDKVNLYNDISKIKN